MSTRKDRARAIGIWKIPSHLSKATFEKKFDAFTDALVALPIGQKHFVKFELMFQNDRLDEHLQALGLPAPEQTVVCIVEGDNWDTLMTARRDKDI
ncbi:hypothetical protein B0H11DRAFT_2220039 [Mycena galericulata]|nr:hypothetical protein B0H11DRAFT_2220039 [Mycena galericulata]